MYFANGSDIPETVPVWKFDQGKVQNIRPTSYHRDAEADMKQFANRSIIGYVVQNQYGDEHNWTFKIFHRMKDIVDRGMVKPVRYWYAHNLPAEYALAGFDTEGAGAGMHRLG